ncbi:glycosyltransferase [Clostridium nigeriense]|uniref:glycosyltransferase n=1 Tax=Clostridium nigeriense TaxID=1805470 RepID=UPI003D33A31B
MKTSVVLATYNGEKFIVEQLDSLLKQTKKIDEVLIFDDCSTDSTVEIIQNYIKDKQLEKNWRCVVNEKNQGYANNFFFGMSKAKNSLIFFCDQDDIWELDRVEYMSKIMEGNSKIKLLCSEFKPFYTGEGVKELPQDVLKKMTYTNTLEFLPLNHKNVFIGAEGCTMAVRKSFFEEIKPYWFNSWAHDEFVWKMAVANQGCYMLHRSTLKRRVHGNNVSINKLHEINKRIVFLKNLMNGHIKMLQYMKDMNCTLDDQKLIEKNIRAVELRLQLLEKNKYLNIIPLSLFYSKFYHSRKSILMETYIAWRNK